VEGLGKIVKNISEHKRNLDTDLNPRHLECEKGKMQCRKVKETSDGTSNTNVKELNAYIPTPIIGGEIE
jgi:hypothetical protein